MDNWSQFRTDGPNDTAALKAFDFNNSEGKVQLNSQDDTWDGVPTRVVANINVNVPETEVDQAPKLASKGIEAELQTLKQTGATQLATPVADDNQAAEFRRIAAANGAGYTEVEKDGSRQAVMVPGVATAVNTNTDSFKAADALSQGYKPEELVSFFQNKGYDPLTIADVMNTAGKVNDARKVGYDDTEINQHLDSSQVSVKQTLRQAVNGQDTTGKWASSNFGRTDVPVYDVTADTAKRSWAEDAYGVSNMEAKNTMYNRMVSDQQMSAEDLLTSMKVLAPNMASMTTRTAAFFGNQEAAQKAFEGIQASRTRIISMAKERGLDLTWDDQNGMFLANTENGQVPIDESAWDDLLAQKGEIAGAVAGGIYGFKLGAGAASTLPPLARAAAAAGGSIGGAAIGSAIGSQFDYMYQAIKLQEDMEGSVMAHKALTAAEVSVVSDVLTLGVLKTGGATMKSIARVKDIIMDGNSKGAYEALKRLEFMSDDAAEQTVNQMARISGQNGLDLSKRFEEQAIAATAVTKPGAEGLVAAAASVNPRASGAVATAINERARDLLRTTSSVTPDGLPQILRDDLGNYVADVKNAYASVKARGAQAPYGSNFKFDVEKLAIKPVLANLAKQITDPATQQKFILQMSRVNDLTDGRTFSDLLELRQLVNEFKYNKNIRNARDFEAVNGVLKNIDNTIDGASGFVFGDKKAGDAWLNDFYQSRLDYSKMKQVEDNVMYKALNRPGIDADTITKSLARYISSVDGTWDQVVSKLPAKTKMHVENSVVDTLANKYTAGIGEGIRAVNFPMLANELKQVNLTTTQARQMRAAITELSEVFKNDVPLSQITGSIQIPKFQSYLTTDPIARVKYEVASGIFNYVKTLIPGKSQGSLALVSKTAQLLENPMNAKLMKELMTETAGKVDISPSILKLQQDTARAMAAGKDVSMPKVKLYGDGSVLSAKAGSGAEQQIPLHRIASFDQALEIATTEGIRPTDTKLLDAVLANYGFKAVQQGADKVRVLK